MTAGNGNGYLEVRRRGLMLVLSSPSGAGKTTLSRLLLERGADVEVKSNNGKAALQVAVEKGRDEIVKLLREHGAK